MGGRPILDGLRVLDLTRLAPGPYCTMLLADLGAEVIVVGGGRAGLPIAAYGRGKRFIRLDLKSAEGLQAFRRLAGTADVLVEGFRPGVCDKLGIGHEAMQAENPRLIYCSLTGYGQNGPYAHEAGHDINYVGLSGALGAFGPAAGTPTVPLNLLADFAGGGLYAAYAVVAALLERERSGAGQHLDVAMIDGCISLMAMHFSDWGKPVLPERGRGLLAGEAPFYRCYRCADGRHVSVGALERPFFENLWRGLGFEPSPPDHMDRAGWPQMAQRFEQAFAGRTRDAWAEHFAGRDACVAPVLAPDEVFADAHVHERHPNASADRVPALPRFSRTEAPARVRDMDDQTMTVLQSVGLTRREAAAAMPGAEPGPGAGLTWPPMVKG